MLEKQKAIDLLTTSFYISSQDDCTFEHPSGGVWEFTINRVPDHSFMYIVCNEEGEEEILSAYREASIEGAKLDIPELYHDFFEFNDFADYTWQSIYDVYDDVTELFDEEGKKYYICLV